MTFALALVLASLDGGRHGDAFALHGIGVPVWEQYRRFEGDNTFPPVRLDTDGGALRFADVRQGCNDDGGGCVFAAPGVFISRVPGLTSPAFSPVWFSDVQPNDRVFDVRFALLEAAADGGLQVFVQHAGGDNGREMDPYFSPGVDGLVVHATFKADSNLRTAEFVNATCTTAGSPLREELRTNWLSDGSASSVAVPAGAQLSWGLVDAGGGTVAFSVAANQSPLWRWSLPSGRLSRCGNVDDGGYQDDQLSLSRLVPVLYVGWASFRPPSQNATMTMGFGGHGPQFGAVPTTLIVGQRLQVPVRLVDGDGNLALGASTGVEVSAFGPESFPRSTVRPGVAPAGEVTVEFMPTVPQALLVRLEIDNSFVAVERVITILPASDAGVDAGVTDGGALDAGLADAGEVDAGRLDAGVFDAGVLIDAGALQPDGGAPDRVDLRVGCGCSATNASTMLLVLLALVVRRRR